VCPDAFPRQSVTIGTRHDANSAIGHLLVESRHREAILTVCIGFGAADHLIATDHPPSAAAEVESLLAADGHLRIGQWLPLRVEDAAADGHRFAIGFRRLLRLRSD